MSGFRQAAEFPFVVRTTPGGSTFLGFDTEQAALDAATEANKNAVALEITTRYVVTANTNPSAN